MSFMVTAVKISTFLCAMEAQIHLSMLMSKDPDVITFNSTMSSFQHGDAASWLLALQLLDEMPQHRLVPAACRRLHM